MPRQSAARMNRVRPSRHRHRLPPRRARPLPSRYSSNTHPESSTGECTTHFPGHAEGYPTSTPECSVAGDALADDEPAAENRAPVSISQRLGAAVVALFAIAFTRGPALIRLFNPVMRRLLVTRLPAGPNVLLKVRGRRSGLTRTFPVAFLDLGDRGYVQAASGNVDWVHNLREAGQAVIIRRGRARTFEATALDPETGGRLLRDLLAPFPRSHLIRAIVGPIERPPVAVLRYFRLRVDDMPNEYIALARRQPVFELRRLGSQRTGGLRKRRVT